MFRDPSDLSRFFSRGDIFDGMEGCKTEHPFEMKRQMNFDSVCVCMCWKRRNTYMCVLWEGVGLFEEWQSRQSLHPLDSTLPVHMKATWQQHYFLLLMFSLSFSLFHSLTHSLTPSLQHTVILSLSLSIIPSPSHSLSISLSYKAVNLPDVRWHPDCEDCVREAVNVRIRHLIVVTVPSEDMWEEKWE